jgi:hypothetical protein
MTGMNHVKLKQPRVALRGYLLHLTHYDPPWVKNKKREQPFELDMALEIVDELARTGFNALLVGVSDGVRYRSHPELTRPYSVPMKQLEALCRHARKQGLEIVPKLNFSKSAINCHDHWKRAPGEEWHTHFDDPYYWKVGFDAIDEVIDACKPARFFHVGMDEDHERSYTQYLQALLCLRTGLKKRKLRMVSWSDSGLDYASGDIYREKSLAAERKLPSDCVRLMWNYWAIPAPIMRGIRKNGLELWGAPGWNDAKQVEAFRDALLAAGGTGLVMTRWIACRKNNRRTFLDLIRNIGPLYKG